MPNLAYIILFCMLNHILVVHFFSNYSFIVVYEIQNFYIVILKEEKYMMIPLLSLFILIFIGCPQVEDTTLPEVSYTFIVSDSISLEPIDSVQILIKDENLTSHLYFTDSEGREDSELILSRLNQISFDKEGYLAKDTVDQISLPEDSTLTLQFKTIRVNLLKITDRDSINRVVPDTVIITDTLTVTDTVTVDESANE